MLHVCVPCWGNHSRKGDKAQWIQAEFALLNDPKALEQALGAVSALLGSDNVQGQETASTAQNTDYDPSADLMQRAMPLLSRIAQGGQNAVEIRKNASCSTPSNPLSAKQRHNKSTTECVWYRLHAWQPLS